MANVKTFVLDGASIDVLDQTARDNATAAVSAAAKNTAAIAELEKLSRLSVQYNESTSTITFTTSTHNV